MNIALSDYKIDYTLRCLEYIRSITSPQKAVSLMLKYAIFAYNNFLYCQVYSPPAFYLSLELRNTINS